MVHQDLVLKTDGGGFLQLLLLGRLRRGVPLRAEREPRPLHRQRRALRLGLSHARALRLESRLSLPHLPAMFLEAPAQGSIFTTASKFTQQATRSTRHNTQRRRRGALRVVGARRRGRARGRGGGGPCSGSRGGVMFT